MRTALVHDFLIQFGGAERVLLELAKIFPEAPIYTLLYDEKTVGKYFPKEKVRTSCLQKLPAFIRRKHRFLLPLYPVAIEQFDLRDFHLVISSSGAFSKNIITRTHTKHISYIHSPMRYAWDFTHEYVGENHKSQITNNKQISNFKFQILKIGGIGGLIVRLIISWLRVWDWSGRDRADEFLANSEHTKKRISKYYRKEAEVVYPPVDTEFFDIKKEAPRSYFLVVSRLSAYKNVELVVKLFNKIKLPLVVAGTGSELENLIGLNQSAETKFTGKVTDLELRSLYQHARALIFPGEEDFGMVPVEAMACGTPVIGLGVGGLRETVVNETGIMFEKPCETDLISALTEFQLREKQFVPEKIRKQALKFSKEIFSKKIREIIKK